MTYSYEVQAVNSAGSSPFSVAQSATVTLPSAVPATPIIQSVTPDSTNTELVVTWGPASGATSYDILREDPGQSTFTQIVSGITAATYADATLNTSGTYSYEVVAVNSVGSSPASAPISGVITIPGPQAPAAPSGVVATVSGDSVVITWVASDTATSYIVQAAKQPANQASPISPPASPQPPSPTPPCWQGRATSMRSSR